MSMQNFIFNSILEGGELLSKNLILFLIGKGFQLFQHCVYSSAKGEFSSLQLHC